MNIVGFDLGKRKSHIAICDKDGRILEERAFRTTKDAIAKAFADLRGCEVLIEASTSSEWVACHLKGLGCTVIVADPRFTPMYAHGDKKQKSDKRDARALAVALRLGAYREAHRKSLAARQIRARL